MGIGQAQVNYPDLLILDEPAASLDPLGRRDVLEVMARLKKYATVFYSTHILDDVQKVSDTVAILNNGELVTHGPIEELLAGSGGTAYSITIRGDFKLAQERILEQTWATQTVVTEKDGETSLVVSVNDTEAAEAQLVRLLLVDEHLVITEFKRKTHDLEEIFMEIVEGGNNGRK